jgi:hypothetical protein
MLARWLAITMLASVGCHRPEQAPVAVSRSSAVDAGPPAVLDLEWFDPPGTANPRPEDHALALFPEDEWNRALPCPESLADAQPDDTTRHRCAFRPTAALRVGGVTFWVGAATFDHEWDGMYGHDEELVIAVPGPSGLRVAHTLVQWSEEVVDCFTEVRLRRRALADLDRDGADELCIESVLERGAGLFMVIDLGGRGRSWTPIERTRDITAWRASASGVGLERVGNLDERCPREGYALFVDTRPSGDAVSSRRGVQGESPTASCPAWGQDACPDVDISCAEFPSAPHDSLDSDAPSPRE